MFFRKSAFGLDISDFSIEVLQLSSRTKVKAFGRVILERGVVKDGLILDKEKLAKKIKEVISQAKIRADKVILSLPESKTFIHFFEEPQSIEGEARKTIPLEPEKIYADWQKIGQDILYVATPKEILDNYIEVLIKAGLEPTIFDVESMALARALLKHRKPKTNTTIVDIGARTTNISIFDSKLVLRNSVTVKVAGDCFTKAIAEKLKISPDKAEKLKTKCGLDEKKEEGRVMLVLQKELQPILEKIRESVKYYGQGIVQVFLAGGSAKMPKIVDYFSANLELKVDIGASPLASQLGGKSALFNTVVGLALRALERNPEKRSINLLPERKEIRLLSLPKKKKIGQGIRAKRYFPHLAIGFGILALLFLGWIIYVYIFKAVPFREVPSPSPLSSPSPSPQFSTSPAEEVIVPESTAGEEEEIIEVVIKETETGWLKVRSGPGTIYEEITKIYPGEGYPLLEESGDWYKIKIDEEEGWIAKRYAQKQ